MVVEEYIWDWKRGIEACCDWSRNEEFYYFLFEGSD